MKQTHGAGGLVLRGSSKHRALQAGKKGPDPSSHQSRGHCHGPSGPALQTSELGSCASHGQLPSAQTHTLQRSRCAGPARGQQSPRGSDGASGSAHLRPAGNGSAPTPPTQISTLTVQASHQAGPGVGVSLPLLKQARTPPGPSPPAPLGGPQRMGPTAHTPISRRVPPLPGSRLYLLTCHVRGEQTLPAPTVRRAQSLPPLQGRGVAVPGTRFSEAKLPRQEISISHHVRIFPVQGQCFLCL